MVRTSTYECEEDTTQPIIVREIGKREEEDGKFSFGHIELRGCQESLLHLPAMKISK